MARAPDAPSQLTVNVIARCEVAFKRGTQPVRIELRYAAEGERLPYEVRVLAWKEDRWKEWSSPHYETQEEAVREYRNAVDAYSHPLENNLDVATPIERW